MGTRTRSEVASAELEVLKEGLAKVVEAAQQERRSRCESDEQLREDCRKAIDKEIRARQDSNLKVLEGIRAEARLREEALKAADLGIAECKRGLESHAQRLQDWEVSHPSSKAAAESSNA